MLRLPKQYRVPRVKWTPKPPMRERIASILSGENIPVPDMERPPAGIMASSAAKLTKKCGNLYNILKDHNNFDHDLSVVAYKNMNIFLHCCFILLIHNFFCDFTLHCSAHVVVEQRGYRPPSKLLSNFWPFSSPAFLDMLPISYIGYQSVRRGRLSSLR